MTKKSYVLNSGGVQYALHLSSDYDGIKDACGITDMPAVVPDNVVDESETSICRKGKAIKVSVGLENGKRRKVIVSTSKSIKGLIGKSFGGSNIKSSSVVQHIRLG
ncbi:hypothetical protein [Nostoc sp.]|uniref:hypothetical protein n=1 Tax=Nostoc sp. TaxID=1180 RepID=UPI002FF87EE2